MAKAKHDDEPKELVMIVNATHGSAALRHDPRFVFKDREVTAKLLGWAWQADLGRFGQVDGATSPEAGIQRTLTTAGFVDIEIKRKAG